MDKKSVVKKVNIDDLKPRAGEPVVANEIIKKIEMSIKEYGYVQLIVVNKENEILAGHKVWLALKRTEIKEIDVVEVDLSEEEQELFRVIDNQTSSLAEWKDKELIQELREVEDLSIMQEFFDIDLKGWVDSFTGLGLRTFESKDIDKAREQDFVEKNLKNYEENMREVKCPNCGYIFRIGK